MPWSMPWPMPWPADSVQIAMHVLIAMPGIFPRADLWDYPAENLAEEALAKKEAAKAARAAAKKADKDIDDDKKGDDDTPKGMMDTLLGQAKDKDGFKSVLRHNNRSLLFFERSHFVDSGILLSQTTSGRANPHHHDTAMQHISMSHLCSVSV